MKTDPRRRRSRDSARKSWSGPALAMLSLACLQSLQGAAASEGPFDTGVFSRRQPGEQALRAYRDSIQKQRPAPVAAVGQYLADSTGTSNELIVLLDEGDVNVRAMLPRFARDGLRSEDVLVQGVRGGDRDIKTAFGQPIDARHLIADGRLDDAGRRLLKRDDPRLRLQRYVVLRYSSVGAALQARSALIKKLGPASVGGNPRFQWSSAPNDPYFAIKPGATNPAQYQWGLHAMSFPAAWDKTPGHGYVAAIDTGIPTNTPSDLMANYRPQFSDLSASFWMVGHGTHVSGIIAATANNGSGVTGGCPSCSLAVFGSSLEFNNVAGHITALVDKGFQAFNMSFGWPNDPATILCPNPTVLDYKPICDALSYASSRDVLPVAAAGNYNANEPQFPASVASVLSVGGLELNKPVNPATWSKWYYGPFVENGQNVTIASNYPGGSGVMAPARGIVSTFPLGDTWNAELPYRCADTNGVDESGVANDAAASCTGTSMAAPFVTALAGVLRSINPRLNAAQIRANITGSAGSFTSSYGNKALRTSYGLPNVNTAVTTTISQTSNRLTPLFAFYSANRTDYFYTSVPQMAAAAVSGTLAPRASGSPSTMTYGAVGSAVNGYPSFPGVSGSALAQVWVFTTPVNPKNAADPLWPLYRLSWKCGDATPTPPTAICASFPKHIDVVYTADPAGVTAYKDSGYKLDGIEGYLYPKTSPQPAGTVRLMRKYNPARDDHAIFPETLLSAMQAQGYTQDSGSDWLGYVYPNTGGVPVIQ